MADDTAERLEVREDFVKPVTVAGDIVDIVRDAMDALQPESRHPGGHDRQLAYDELASILDFFGAEILD